MYGDTCTSARHVATGHAGELVDVLALKNQLVRDPSQQLNLGILLYMGHGAAAAGHVEIR